MNARFFSNGLLLSGLVLLDSGPALAAAFARDVCLFLEQHCVTCHRFEKQKGDILTEGTRWAVVLDKVRSGEMAPEEAKQQPTSAQRKTLIDWVTGQFGAHAQRKPNLGNLVPPELIFGRATNASETNDFVRGACIQSEGLNCA